MTAPNPDRLRDLRRLLRRDDGLSVDTIAKNLGVGVTQARQLGAILVAQGRAEWVSGYLCRTASPREGRRPA